MKLSVTLSDEDIAVLDADVESVGLPSRSAGLQLGIRMLRHRALEDGYAQARDEWSAAGEDEIWEGVIGDEVSHAPR